MASESRPTGAGMEVFVCRENVDTEGAISAVRKRYPEQQIRVVVCNTAEELAAGLERQCREEKAGEGRFPVKTAMGLRFLPMRQLVYCRSEGHRFHVWMEDGEKISSLTIRHSFGKAAEPLLKTGNFLRCNASTVVNISFIRLIHDGDIILTDGTSVSFPAHRQAETKGLLGLSTKLDLD